jgi:regulator of sirC expression with transglutaminase-like and TPR domain
MMLSKYEYPDVNPVALRNQIETMRIEAWVRLNPDDKPENKVAILNEILFDKYHFKGNTQNYHHPDNSFLNKVIETRTGNPISLCVVYMIIAQKLGMSIFGINLPEHFVLAYLNESPENQKLSIEQRPVLFYINPFNRGVTFKEKEITNFLKIINITPEKKHYNLCSNLLIINRITNNLIHAYNAAEQPHKAEVMVEIQQKIQEKLSAETN